MATLNGNNNEIINSEVICDTLEKLNNEINFNNFTIVHLNIRGLNKNFTLLQQYINYSLKSKPSIIICSETRKLEYPEHYNLDDYYIYYNESKINVSDGVVMYIKKNLQHNIEIFQHDNVKILTAKIHTNDNTELRISDLYRCHNLKSTILIDAIKIFLNQNNHFKNHFIFGDFNINLLNTNDDSESLLNNFSDSGFMPFIQYITRPNERFDRKSFGSCINHIYSYSKLKFETYIYTCIMPDHYPIFC